ncbi:hypothetical protein T484DRAFT_1779056, partial [Baffinella frigidus]
LACALGGAPKAEAERGEVWRASAGLNPFLPAPPGGALACAPAAGAEGGAVRLLLEGDASAGQAPSSSPPFCSPPPELSRALAAGAVGRNPPRPPPPSSPATLDLAAGGEVCSSSDDAASYSGDASRLGTWRCSVSGGGDGCKGAGAEGTLVTGADGDADGGLAVGVFAGCAVDSRDTAEAEGAAVSRGSAGCDRDTISNGGAETRGAAASGAASGGGAGCEGGAGCVGGAGWARAAPSNGAAGWVRAAASLGAADCEDAAVSIGAAGCGRVAVEAWGGGAVCGAAGGCASGCAGVAVSTDVFSAQDRACVSADCAGGAEIGACGAGARTARAGGGDVCGFDTADRRRPTGAVFAGAVLACKLSVGGGGRV